ncbi:MAG: protein kinase [Kiritimatiellae bacterium]|nr:protein kinase [Kiritimatiellia bacterium]
MPISSSLDIDIERGGVTITQFMSKRKIEGGIALADSKETSTASDVIVSKEGRKYNIGKLVAKGGMGAILTAKDLNIRRHVAMKVMLDPNQADDEMILRFIEEAQVTGQLEHPSIVPVHELGVDAHDSVFYTMKYVKGITLKDILQGIAEGDKVLIEQYPLNRLLNVYLKTCEAMAFAHTKGIIHRDLKPENIMVGEFGEVLVMDWGLAKVLGRPEKHGTDCDQSEADTIESARADTVDDSQHTMVGQIMGTPQFMAPEQAMGKIDELNARTDIYSLGGVFYNILTLHPPFEDNHVNKILLKVVKGDIIPPTMYNTPGIASANQENAATASQKAQNRLVQLPHCPEHRIPNALSAVAMKAMALEPENRYQNIGELRADIEAFQGGFATAAENAGTFRQIALLIKRHKTEVSLLATALVVILGLVFGFVLKVNAEKNRAEKNAQLALKARHDAETSEKHALSERKAALQAKDVAEYENYISRIQLAADSLNSGNDIQTRKLLATCPEKYRHWEWGYLTNQCRQIEESCLPRETDGCFHWPRLAVSHNGQLLAVATYEPGVQVRNISTGKIVKTLATEIRCRKGICFLPGSKQILIYGARKGRGGLQCFDIKSGKRLWIHSSRGRGLDTLTLSSDGKLAVSTSWIKNDPPQIWNTKMGKPVGTLPVKYDKKGYATVAKCSPTGKEVLVGISNGVCDLFDLEKREYIRSLRGHRRIITDICFFPDGRSVATASQDASVRIWEVASGKCKFVLTGHNGDVAAVLVTHDGQVVLSGSSDGFLRVWDANTGELLSTLRGPRIYNLTQASDGKTIFVGYDSGRIRRVKLATLLNDSTRNAVINLYGNRVRPTPDGKKVLVGTTHVIVVDLGSGTISKRLTSTGSVPHDFQLTPDGKFIVVGEYSGGNLRICDAKTDKLVKKIKASQKYGEEHCPIEVCLLNKGTLVATAEYHGSPELTVWDIATGKKIRHWTSGEDWIRALAETPDGKALVVAGACNIECWDTQTWEKTTHSASKIGFSGGALCFSPDGQWLASCNGKEIKLLDLKTGKIRMLCGHNLNVFRLSFSPDSQRLVSGGNDCKVIVWDAYTGRPLLTLTEHSKMLTGVGFSSDGRYLISSGFGRKIIIRKADPWK